jgi:hypothetical protein
MKNLVIRRSVGTAALFSGVLGLLAVAVGTLWMGSYGCVLFIFMPVAMGFVSALVLENPENLSDRALAAFLSLVIAGTGLLGVGVEGMICLVMASPLAFGLSIAGAAFATELRRSRRRETRFSLLLLLVLSSPLLMGAEAALDLEDPVFPVSTSVEVDAPPEVVWKNVVSFSELPPPDDWLFHAGIAHPLRAEIRGTGVGAVRYCVFSTGAFVEPITVWDEPRRLAFTVTENPPAMRELSPWGDIHPPHLEGFLVSHRGEFRLEPLPGGRTRLVGTTWYEHGLRPVWYWRLWSDWILHRIHRRVLDHVAHLSEAQAAGG